MSKSDGIGKFIAGTAIVGGVAGTVGTLYTTVNEASKSSFEMETPDTFTASAESFAPLSSGNASSAGVALGSTTLCTTVGAVFGGTGQEPDIIVHTQNNLPYNVVEERATEVYDRLNKSHIPTVAAGATLLTESSEVREVVDQIIDGNNPQELIEALSVMEKVYQKTPTRKSR